MEGTTTVITVSNHTGVGRNETFNAVIDKTISANAISQKRLNDLCEKLQVTPSELGRDKTFVDSYGVVYTARSKVRLLARPRGGRHTSVFDFYVVDTGRYDVLLARGWMDKFPTKHPGEHIAAPTELINNGPAQAKAEEELKKHLEEAAKAQAAFDKRRKEQQAK
ncbi:hypothetical protein ASPVEDRAFT_35177 [Aspergillus versicolor CBS 583.65]|uniref:Uncharacterized protein n=1 Tax=Aspergillus versicolor CBS 583.65 TaxID=1036611 RepID=A0A1L9P2V2_ASPVE|nr:uncharacterized protein ASPVEDRAFT_35177 [Aspergillus versicolor CBS 583.65]OJI95870.1 hypothetical protein ASPVEDRAFT_35177 [Aspergillus versicolor CBS 583.65]